METDIEKVKNLPPTLQRLSQSELCRTLHASQFKATSDLLPTTVKGALDQPPICEVMRVTGRGQVVRFIEFELIKLSTLVSVGGNLNDSQVQFIATQMVEMFPNESLADFKLCFERGCIGQYGEIFRMDGIVLRKWMERYLEEKYQHVEDKLIKERDSIYGVRPQQATSEKDWLKIWAEAIGVGSRVPDLDDKTIKREGQEEPARKKTITNGYKYFPVKGVEILAVTQEHAEEIAAKMVKHGMLTDKQV